MSEPCDCLRSIDDALVEKGLPTRLDPAIVRAGDDYVVRAAVRAYVPDDLQPRAASGRIVRRVKPVVMIADYCPFCGERYPRIEAGS